MRCDFCTAFWVGSGCAVAAGLDWWCVPCGIGTIAMAWALGNDLSDVARQAPGATKRGVSGGEPEAMIREQALGWTGAIAALLLASRCRGDGKRPSRALGSALRDACAVAVSMKPIW